MTVSTGDQRIRRSGIGGSDIAAIAGVSKWASPMDVWLAKTGQSAPLVETERMHWGNVLEDVVAKEYARTTKRKVRRAPVVIDPVTSLRSSVIRYSADKPWRMAHVDRLVSGERRGFEAKTADRFAASEFGEPGSDQVPPEYLMQCAWYMGVTGLPVWDLAVLIGGNTFRVYTIERDDDLIEQLWVIGDAFWLDNVVANVPPPIDGSEASRKYLEGIHLAPEEIVPMSDRMYELAHRYETINREIKDLVAEKEEVGNGIIEEMHGKGKAARDNAKVSWSVVTTTRLDAKALAASLPAGTTAPFMVGSESHRLTVNVRESS